MRMAWLIATSCRRPVAVRRGSAVEVQQRARSRRKTSRRRSPNRHGAVRPQPGAVVEASVVMPLAPGVDVSREPMRTTIKPMMMTTMPGRKRRTCLGVAGRAPGLSELAAVNKVRRHVGPVDVDPDSALVKHPGDVAVDFLARRGFNLDAVVLDQLLADSGIAVAEYRLALGLESRVASQFAAPSRRAVTAYDWESWITVVA